MLNLANSSGLLLMDCSLVLDVIRTLLRSVSREHAHFVNSRVVPPLPPKAIAPELFNARKVISVIKLFMKETSSRLVPDLRCSVGLPSPPVMLNKYH